MRIAESLKASVNIHKNFIFEGFPLATYATNANVMSDNIRSYYSVKSEFVFFKSRRKSCEQEKVSNQEMLKRCDRNSDRSSPSLACLRIYMLIHCKILPSGAGMLL